MAAMIRLVSASALRYLRSTGGPTRTRTVGGSVMLVTLGTRALRGRSRVARAAADAVPRGAEPPGGLNRVGRTRLDAAVAEGPSSSRTVPRRVSGGSPWA